MKCPHCLENFHDSWVGFGDTTDVEGRWMFYQTVCPACARLVVKVVHHPTAGEVTEELVHPRTPARAPAAKEVPGIFAGDYREACLVLADSAKASAALSRRCLQNVLRDKAGVKPSDLSKEIDEVIQTGVLPSHLAEGLDAVRNIGNFAAHPIKSANSGEIVDVEPGEAEWSLDVLEGLFDFYFVQPAILQRKKDALNQKLGDAGKPLMT